jgi:hypothetical protein
MGAAPETRESFRRPFGTVLGFELTSDLRPGPPYAALVEAEVWRSLLCLQL